MLVAAQAGWLWRFDLKRRQCRACRFSGQLPATLAASPYAVGDWSVLFVQDGSEATVWGVRAGRSGAPIPLGRFPTAGPIWIHPAQGPTWWIADAAGTRKVTLQAERGTIEILNVIMPSAMPASVLVPHRLSDRLLFAGRRLWRLAELAAPRLEPWTAPELDRITCVAEQKRSVLVGWEAPSARCVWIRAYSPQGTLRWQSRLVFSPPSRPSNP